MSRLDARINADLQARTVFPFRANAREEWTRIKNLSLTGVFLEGLKAADQEGLSVKLDLPGLGKVVLSGEAVRGNGQGSALRLYWTDRNILEMLWLHIRENLPKEENCSYCGHIIGSKMNLCPTCGLYLNFGDENYLEKHFKNTIGKRLSIRLDRLDLDQFCKVAQFINGEVLKIHDQSPEDEFVGNSPAMLKVFSIIRKVAATDMSVLILGESGTGKELTARAIHERSERKNHPFVAINCAAIPEGLLEAELFGHEKGAFTGAHAARKGKFEIADGGTLFLDEIGDLSPGLQAKLLRFLEDRIIERVGGKGTKKVDVRIVAATNRNLDWAVAEGKFRMDLYFRLNAFIIRLPSLKERGEDKIVLARFFLQKISRTEGGAGKDFSEEALTAIRNYPWPGNVRELINKIRRGAVMASGKYIQPVDMELTTAPAESSRSSLRERVSQTRKDLLLDALARHDFVISRAAKALKISRPSLYALLRKHDIALPRPRR